MGKRLDNLGKAKRYAKRRDYLESSEIVRLYGKPAWTALRRATPLIHVGGGRYRVCAPHAPATATPMRFGDGGAFAEGHAACLLGVGRERNPYRVGLAGAPSASDALRARLTELANAWDSGWVGVLPVARGSLVNPTVAVLRANESLLRA